MVAMGESSSSSSNSAPQVGSKPLLATFVQNVGTVLNNNLTVEKGKLLKGPIVGDFVVDNQYFACSQIPATFYPKFENEKSDQEVSLLLFLQF